MSPEETPFELAPIEKIDVFRAIMEQLEKAVAQLAPGEKLGSERQLAKQLRVSRVSVREALRALESMGKIEIRPQGSFVQSSSVDIHHPLLASVTSKTLAEIADVRAAIEAEVVRAVIRGDADLSQARLALERREREIGAGGGDPGGSLDLHFEVELARAGGNTVLQDFQRAIHRLWVEAWLSLGGKVAGPAKLHAEHVAILRALDRRDEEGAVDLMVAHVTGAGAQ